MNPDGELVPVELVRILISECDGDHRIVLQETGGERCLSIAIGPYEALAIHAAVNGDIPPRPMTHDLAADLITQLDGLLKEVVVDRFVINEDGSSGTFHGKLVCDGPAGERIIDCRPSDAVALAVRLDVRIRVAEGVLDSQAA